MTNRTIKKYILFAIVSLSILTLVSCLNGMEGNSTSLQTPDANAEQNNNPHSGAKDPPGSGLSDVEKIQHYITTNSIKPHSPTNQKPLPPGVPGYTQPVKAFAYVEGAGRGNNILNIAKIVLKDSRVPFFDYIMIFAPNMNWNADKLYRYIHFNKDLQTYLRDPDSFIKPLQEKLNIKVLATLLPNHQGAGYANFQTKEGAHDFVLNEVKYYTDLLGLDGWNIDEEYPVYSSDKQVPSDDSYYWYLTSMKEIMPDKLLTLYGMGGSDITKFFEGKSENIANYLDFVWSPTGLVSQDLVEMGLPSDRMGTMGDADSVLSQEWGVYTEFNPLHEFNNYSFQTHPDLSDLSSVSMLLYGEEVEFVGDVFEKPPLIFVNEQYDYQSDGFDVQHDYQRDDYSIGERGPAGGIVFYDKGQYSYGWRYLEAAPSDTAERVFWGDHGYGTRIRGTYTDIGTGRANTLAIVTAERRRREGIADDYRTEAHANGYYGPLKRPIRDNAAQVCYDLVLGGYDDWFLPSKDELNELYKQEKTVGGFASFSYWSSSQFDRNPSDAWELNFINGNQDTSGKFYDNYVRAVRAF